MTPLKKSKHHKKSEETLKLKNAPVFQRPLQTVPYAVSMMIVKDCTRPPKKVSNIRDSEQGKQLRQTAYEALATLEVGHRVEFSGDDVTRELLNSYINGYVLYTLKTINLIGDSVTKNKRFFVSKIEGTRYGIWRVR